MADLVDQLLDLAHRGVDLAAQRVEIVGGAIYVAATPCASASSASTFFSVWRASPSRALSWATPALFLVDQPLRPEHLRVGLAAMLRRCAPARC